MYCNFNFSFQNSIFEVKLYIPIGYETTEKYRGSLGHKINHSFSPNTIFKLIETARFRVTVAIFAAKNIEKGEEILVSYNYELPTAPLWYKKLYTKSLQSE